MSINKMFNLSEASGAFVLWAGLVAFAAFILWLRDVIEKRKSPKPAGVRQTVSGKLWLHKGQAENRKVFLIALIFVAGFFFGRRFPAHHYQAIGISGLLFDVNTGGACLPPQLDRGSPIPACTN